MKAIVQRVKSASVRVDNEVIGKIDTGILVLLGIGIDDDEKTCDWMLKKIINLRIFPNDEDPNNTMDKSVEFIKGGVLVISNFTLYGDTRKGNRPSYSKAAPPEKAKQTYELFMRKIKETGLDIQEGKFQAMMDVELVNWGPVTLSIEKD